MSLFGGAEVYCSILFRKSVELVLEVDGRPLRLSLPCQDLPCKDLVEPSAPLNN